LNAVSVPLHFVTGTKLTLLRTFRRGLLRRRGYQYQLIIRHDWSVDTNVMRQRVQAALDGLT